MAKKILIIGATGNFGLEIRKYLLENTDYYLTLISRHAERLVVDKNRERAVNVDATNLEALKNVMAGQDIVFSACYTDNLADIAGTTVEAMRQTGVQRILFTAAMGIYNEIPDDIDPADNVDNCPAQVPNRDGALIVENSELNYTILRPGYFQKGTGPYKVTRKGEPVTGYHTAYNSIIEVAARLMEHHTGISRESIAVNQV